MDLENRLSSRLFYRPLKTLYLHGFLSSAESAKGRWLGDANRQHPQRPLGDLVALNYRQKNLLAGIEPIAQQLADWQKQEAVMMIIGSSLGGYLAQYFAHQYDCSYVMINPALNPLTLFDDYLGTHCNPYTQERVVVDQVYQQQLAQLEIAAPNAALNSLLLVDNGDEIVDIDFACRKYQGLQKARIRRYPGGNHAFEHRSQGWQEIVRFVKALSD